MDIAPLTMSVNSPRSRSHIPWTGDKDKLYMGLPPMIADSLPDKWGHSLYRAWLRDHHIPADDHSKNFSFCMTSDGKWKLSPAYGLTYSVDL